MKQREQKKKKNRPNPWKLISYDSSWVFLCVVVLLTGEWIMDEEIIHDQEKRRAFEYLYVHGSIKDEQLRGRI